MNNDDLAPIKSRIKRRKVTYGSVRSFRLEKNVGHFADDSSLEVFSDSGLDQNEVLALPELQQSGKNKRFIDEMLDIVEGKF